MARFLCFLSCLAAFSISPLTAIEIGIVQETSFSSQVQTVQAVGYWGTQQLSYGAQWTIGLDVDRSFTLRGGLSARQVKTSPVEHFTVYPGYLGWGWVAAADWLALRGQTDDTSWAAGLTLAGGWEYLSYPGLFRDFELLSGTVSLLGEVVPSGTSGLTYRLRVPVTVDQRQGFSLSWRMGIEAAVVFRGVGWSFP